MRTSDMFKEKRVFSFEVFPPKHPGSLHKIYETMDGLKRLRPDFISVTFGAGGSENCKTAFELAAEVKHRWGIESVAHLPCIGLTKEDVLNQLNKLRDAGIENILALRGDLPAGSRMRGDFHYADQLISFIRSRGDFHLIAACYPEGHSESQSIPKDIENLKRKVDAGADHLITQLFFYNESFFRFRERCQLAGIVVPIEAGIMPVVNKKQMVRMTSLGRVHLPRKFIMLMEKYEDDPEGMQEAGISYATEQIEGLVSEGVDGIHLYTMNNPYVAARIHEAVCCIS